MDRDHVYIWHPGRGEFLHYIAHRVAYWTPSARLAQGYYKLSSAQARRDRLGEGCRLVGSREARRLEAMTTERVKGG